LIDHIPLTDCIKGRVYRVYSRNLLVGAYDGDGGFVGIREKFEQEYLDTEYHTDRGETVSPVKDLGVDVPKDIELKEYLGVIGGGIKSNWKLFDFLRQIELEALKDYDQ